MLTASKKKAWHWAGERNIPVKDRTFDEPMPWELLEITQGRGADFSIIHLGNKQAK